MLPTTPSEWESLLAHATDDERREIYSILESDLSHHIWRAQVGRQSEAADSLAYITGYGGSAGGGKTDLVCGLATMEHERSVVFRKEKVQTEGIVQRLGEILGTTDGYNSQKSAWRYDGKLIEFGGLDNPNDHQKWQGRAHDLKAYDEVTEMREYQVRFTMGWARSPDPKQRVRILQTFNPPTTVEGRWVVDYYKPWLDSKHPNPAAPGELRWFTTIAGKDMEVPDSRKFVMFRGEPLYDFDPNEFPIEKIITPKSRTFIPSRATDNFFYLRSGYIDTLQALPEPLRSQMLEGDFNAGVTDDAKQVIPTSWIDAAQKRWAPRTKKGEMDGMGVDVAAGGADNMVIYCRHDNWIDEALVTPGNEIPQEKAGPIAAGKVMMARRDRAVVHTDVIGWGLSCYNFLVENEIQTVPVNFANGTEERSSDGLLKMTNMRALCIWRMREALDPSGPDPIAIPPEQDLKADLASYRWEMRSTGVFIMSKDDQKKLLGRSPDKGDACCLANIRTLKDEVMTMLAQATVVVDRYAELD